jgi:hypothetical protein
MSERRGTQFGVLDGGRLTGVGSWRWWAWRKVGLRWGVGGALVGEDGEVGEVPQGTVALGEVKMRPGWAIEGWSRGGPHGRGKQSVAGEWEQWDGVRRSRSSRGLHCNHAQREKACGAAHGADDRGGARATGAWPRSYRARVRPAIGHHLSGARDWQVGPDLFYFSRFSNTQILKFEMVTFLMSKFLQILQVDCLKHKEQV